ncbi:MAG: acetyl/propionyl/methylcrotonyl-CoA carboxylase subunit alpha [Paracoccaceae bacterium]
MVAKRTPFSTLLIANRGEIACRIMRTARRLGLRTIAVHTDADRRSPHVRLADRAVRIGAGPVASSYLCAERLLDAARQSGAEAIHPGYGFLSENAEFASAVRAADMVFVGPSSEAIDAMGDKAAARRLMIKAGVPVIKGFEGGDQSDAAFRRAAQKIGYPVMIKAAAGGGGRGMRLVERKDDLARALKQARAEALGAFGARELILEQAIRQARHVEIQVFADRAGNTIHLGERDCSIQRRHQKVIEEAPSPAIDASLRAQMGDSAINATRAVGYEGAGTVEFLLDESGAFHFLEMNTRLQVEHPVTEMVTGLDLVAMQLEVATGKDLAITQDAVAIHGHAIEARLYAEDPENGFLPASGRIHYWHAPDGDGIRTDSGLEAGITVSSHYDPLLAKVIAHGESREIARTRLVSALNDAPLFGPVSNRDFLIEVLGDRAFASGNATTGFVAERFGAGGPPAATVEFDAVATAAALAYRADQRRALEASGASPLLAGWASTGALQSRAKLATGKDQFDLRLTESANGQLVISDGTHSATITGDGREMRLDGLRVDIRASLITRSRANWADAGRTWQFERVRASAISPDAASASELSAPMHGRLVELCVARGDTVAAGTVLAVLEAMKMQHELTATADGRVGTIHAEVGAQLGLGDLILEVDAEDNAP